MKITILTPTIRPQALPLTAKCLEEQTFKDFEWLTDINDTGEHDLNRAYNRLLKRSKGELIVFLQDYIKIRPDYLQRFWDAYQGSPRTFFTAPVGKVDDLNNHQEARWDWRAYEDAKPDYKCWEIDSGCAPRAALFEVGGFDEELDKWWSFDNVSVAKRADMLGYKFANLFTNPALAFDHDKFAPHPFRDKQRKKLIEMRLDSYADPHLTYLD